MHFLEDCEHTVCLSQNFSAHSKKSKKENNLTEGNTILEKYQLPPAPPPPLIKETLLQNCAGKPRGCSLDPLKTP